MFGDSDPQQLSQRRAELRTWMEGIMQLESRQGDADAEENALESSVIEQLNDAYDEEVHFLDRNLGRLFDFIDGRAAVDGESLIFLTADHGEQLADNGWFWGHGASLSREELHVPMLLRLPGQKAGRRVVGAVQTIDVFPTIVELVARESAKTISLEGRSLVPLLRSEESMDPGFAFSGWNGETSIISGEHQLLFDDDGERLLRLVDGTPVSDEAEANRLKALSGGQSAEDSGYDEAIIERLKANGYLR